MRDYNKENDYNKMNVKEDYTAPFSGYLYKRSKTGEWQKRYFEINGTYLIYYKNHTMAKLLAAVPITQLGNVQISNEITDPNGVVIQIDLKDRHYYLRADSYLDAEKWVKHLIFIRDGKLTKDELSSALKSPAGQKNIGYGEFATCYNPQHHDSNASTVSTLSASSAATSFYVSASMSEDEMECRTKPLPRRSSDANWQKTHRGIFYYICIRIF